MAARPTCTVVGLDGATGGSTALPAAFSAPIRNDIVQFVHTNMNKNKRQARCVNVNAGKQSAAESWGTGRAVSRIPRVPGGGTHRAGQAAFGNMCREGHMFAPTKTWRKWHHKININQKRYAVVSALAASAVAPLVMARGHKIDGVSEIPLVLDDSVESLSKTAKAVQVLKAVGAYADVEKSINSKNIRSGKGKMRNRRYVLRKGPLVIYGNDSGLVKAFRNLPGVDLCSVDSLNLLQLAPGGHLGRFCIWTKSAISKIDTIYSSSSKKDYVLPRSIMANSDLNRVINSDEIQSIVNAPKSSATGKKVLKRNPLKNLGAMLKLNPYAKTARRNELLASASKSKATKGTKSAVAKKFYAQLIADSEYDNDNCVHFTTWLNRGTGAE